MSCRNMYRVTQSTNFGRQHLMPDCYSFFFFFKLVVNQYSILIKFIIKCLYKHILAFLVGCPRTLRSNHSCAFLNLNTSFAQLHWIKYALRWLHFESTVHILVTYTGSSAIIDENLIRLYNQYGVSILRELWMGRKVCLSWRRTENEKNKRFDRVTCIKDAIRIILIKKNEEVKN